MTRRRAWLALALFAPSAFAASGCGTDGIRAPTPRVDARMRQDVDTRPPELGRLAAELRGRLSDDPFDGPAAVRLADVLLREARATGRAGLVQTAETHLRRISGHNPADYQACRALAAVLASAHRFADAIAEGRRCLALEDNDAWLHGVLADAHFELGDYEAGFTALDRMLALEPTAAAYARVSYARELQGDLAGATELMTLALAAVSPADVEAQAWYRTHLAHLHTLGGDLVGARRELAHALFVFPGYVLAVEADARALASLGQPREALDRLRPLLDGSPTPSLFALAGDLHAALGQSAQAELHYRLAEAAWQSDVPEPGALARFLAERGRRPAEALALAESAWALRRDIYTADTLAWAYYGLGRLEEAARLSAEALRTGTLDPAIRGHAAVIRSARSSSGGPR